MSYITNKLAGNITVAGSLVPSTSTSDLGGYYQPFGNLYVGSHSIFISNPNPNVPSTELSVNSSNVLVVGRGGLAVRNNANTYDVMLLDPLGTLTVRSNIAQAGTIAAVQIIGNETGYTNEPALPGVMLHTTGIDNVPSRFYNDSYGNTAYSAYIGRHARGTADTPLQVLSGDILARVGANAWGSGPVPGFSSISTTRIDMVAAENQTNTTRGSNLQIWVTPTGSNVIVRVATFDTAGISLVSNVLVGTDLTVIGNSISFGTNTTYGNLVTYGNVVSYGSITSNGLSISGGSSQINGSTTFAGNVTALKGIMFSDGSNVTTAGVSYVNPGTGLTVTAAANNGINLTTSAVLGIAGTEDQVYVNRVGGNVTLSLPQDLNTTSNPFFGNLTVGNLTVTGNISATTSSDLQVTNKVIYAGNGATTTNLINQGGFVLGNSQIAVSMLYSASPPGWNFNTDLYAQGNVYIGDGTGGDLHANTAYITGNLQIGIEPSADFANANLQVTGTSAGTVQVTVQNILSDPAASSDFVATADTGTDSINYVDLGINNSTYNSIQYSAQKALDGYLYSSDSNLVISTAKVGKQIVFTAGGIQTGNVAGYINSTRWILGQFGNDDGVTKLQVAGNATFSGNVTVGNITVSGTLNSPFSNATLTTAAQPYITSLGTLTSLDVSDGAGFRDSVNIAGTARIQNSITNASAFAQTLTVAGAAQVNQFISNIEMTTGRITATGNVRVDRLIANSAIQSIGQITSQAIVNNTGIQTDTLNVISAAQVNSMTTNLLTTTNTLNVVGLVITNSLVNNTGIQTNTLNVIAAAQVNSLTVNLQTITNTFNVVGTAITNSLINNVNMTTATFNSTGIAQVSSLISNTNIFSSTLNTSGLAQLAAIYSNTTIQAGTSVSAPAITGNTSITSPNINASTVLRGQQILSNTSITAATILTAQSIVSNSAIAGQTFNLSGAAQVASINSNTTMQSAGTATVNALVSNTAIAAQTLNLSSTLQAASIVSNAAIQGAGNLVIGSVNANTSVYATKFYGDGSSLTGLAAPYSNANVANYLTGPVLVGNLTVGNATPSTSTGTGALVVNGGAGIAGNVYVGNLTVSAGSTAAAPITLSSGPVKTAAVAGAIEYDGYSMYATPSGTQRGVITAAQYFQLGALRALPLAAQPVTNSLFGQSVAVTGGTRYWYEIVASIGKAGANGSVLQYSLGGTAVLVEHDYAVISKLGASNVTIAASSMMNANLRTNFSTMTTITSAPANGSQNFLIQITGMVGIGTGGTLTPQITLDSGTPTAYAVAPGSWMRIYPVGNTSTLGSNVTIGNWS